MESLSLVALEAWACGRPCLLNGDSAVLAGQARRSAGALLFNSPTSLAEVATRLLDDAAEGDRLGTAGRSFVAREYRWGSVVRRLEGLLTAARGALAVGGDGAVGASAGDGRAPR